MKSSEWVTLLEYGMIVAGAVVFLWKVINKHYEYLKEKAKQNSLGAEAIKQWIDADRKVREDFATLKQRVDNQDEIIDKLQGHYDMFVMKAMDLLNLTTKK